MGHVELYTGTLEANRATIIEEVQRLTPLWLEQLRHKRVIIHSQVQRHYSPPTLHVKHTLIYTLEGKRGRALEKDALLTGPGSAFPPPWSLQIAADLLSTPLQRVTKISLKMRAISATTCKPMYVQIMIYLIGTRV